MTRKDETEVHLKCFEVKETSSNFMLVKKVPVRVESYATGEQEEGFILWTIADKCMIIEVDNEQDFLSKVELIEEGK